MGTPVNITVGTVAYHEDTNEISLPLQFSQNVIWYARSDVLLSRVSGSEVEQMRRSVVGENRAYTVFFQPELDTKGEFRVDITAHFLTGTDNDVSEGQFTIMPVNIEYNNVVPSIFYPEGDIAVPNECNILQHLILFNRPVRGIGTDSFETEPDLGGYDIFRALIAQPTVPQANIYPPTAEWSVIGSDLTNLADTYLIRFRNPVPSDVDVVALILKEEQGLAPLEP